MSTLWTIVIVVAILALVAWLSFSQDKGAKPAVKQEPAQQPPQPEPTPVQPQESFVEPQPQPEPEPQPVSAPPVEEPVAPVQPQEMGGEEVSEIPSEPQQPTQGFNDFEKKE